MRKALVLSQVELKDDVKEICDFAIYQKINARRGDFRYTLKNIFTTLELIYLKDRDVEKTPSKKDKIYRRMAKHLGTVAPDVLKELIEGLYNQRTTANHTGDLNVSFSDKIVVDGDEVAVGRLVEHLELLCTDVIEKLISDNDLTTLNQIIDADITNDPNRPKKKSKRL
ncbi:hypothetical protein L0Z65_00040 [Phaeobacter sp. BS52]|uniref:hypothetical protein n=1 Tax=Phaeobacter sp. BS52 TaxID=2907241 RepID=UPI00386D496D